MVAAFALLVGACGSGGSGTVAKQAQQALSSKATTSAPDQTAVSKTTADSGTTSTVTEPARTTTVTKTRTETSPAVTKTQTETASVASGTTTQTTQSNKVLVAPTSTTPENGSETGVPWWGWMLIALGAIGLAVGVFRAGHRHGQHRAAQPPVQAGVGPDTPSGPPGPGDTQAPG
jgi:hypothetical protein